MNKGLVSVMMTKLAQIIASVVVSCFVCTVCSKHRNTVTFLYTLNSETAVVDGDYVNLINVICGTTARWF